MSSYKANIVKFDKVIIFQPLFMDDKILKIGVLSFSKERCGDKYDFIVRTDSYADMGDQQLSIAPSNDDVKRLGIRAFNTNEERDQYYDMMIYLIDETVKFYNKFYVNETIQ